MKMFNFTAEPITRNTYKKGTYKYNAFNGFEFEMECKRRNSNKIRVSHKGEIDNYTMRFVRNGVIVPMPYENKTNGGRINTVNAKYIAYSLRDCKSSCWDGYCNSGVFFMSMSIFDKILDKARAKKNVNHNGKCDGVAIQLKKTLLTELMKSVITKSSIYFETVDDFKTAVIDINDLP